MNAEELLKKENLPADLHWVAEEHKLQPNDPVFLLIAWHWSQTRRAEDTLRAANLQFKTAIDSRVSKITAAVESVSALPEKIAALKAALSPKPDEIAAQIDGAFKPGIDAIRQHIAVIEHASAALQLVSQAALISAQRRQVIAGVVAGLALGVLFGAVLFR